MRALPSLSLFAAIVCCTVAFSQSRSQDCVRSPKALNAAEAATISGTGAAHPEALIAASHGIPLIPRRACNSSLSCAEGNPGHGDPSDSACGVAIGGICTPVLSTCNPAAGPSTCGNGVANRCSLAFGEGIGTPSG